MKAREFEKIVNKLDLKVRNSRDRLAWLEHEGRTIVRTKRSHGNKEAPEHLIRQQLKVNEKELAGLISCSVSKEDYINILVRKKIFSPTPSEPVQGL